MTLNRSHSFSWPLLSVFTVYNTNACALSLYIVVVTVDVIVDIVVILLINFYSILRAILLSLVGYQ